MAKADDEREEGQEATGKPVSAKSEGRARRRLVVQLESQDDLAYVTGQHDPRESEKQIKSPAPRRQPSKHKESAKGERG